MVTNNSYYDVEIETLFEEAKIATSKNEYENYESLEITLTEGCEVKEIYIDGIKIDHYQVDGNIITITEEVITNLTLGEHQIEVRTNLGRPNTTFNIVETFNYIEEEVKANHLFFYIDIAIFLGAILLYIVFSIVKKKAGERYE